ncbi:MAG: Hpt domain-containing protein, partial [Longimicrobiales bacterium]
MDLRDFVALFVTETQEHRRLLDRALLELEQGEGSGSVDEAFRAAHTLKGLSATMGFRAAADQAHALEDRLHRVRTGELATDASELDALLAAADALGAAIDHAVATEEPRVDGWDGPPSPAVVTGLVSDGPVTAGAPVAADEFAVRITLRADAPVKAARAMLVVRAVEQRWRLARTEPATFDDAFAGQLRVVVPADADRSALEAAILAAGEVDTIVFEDAASAAQPLTSGTPARTV